VDRDRHGDAKDASHHEAGTQCLAGYAGATGAERKGCAHTHRGKHREPENQRHSKHGICEGAGGQWNNAHAANHDRIRPSHEHLTDVARNDWRSQREGTAVFGKGLGKKRHEMGTEARGGKGGAETGALLCRQQSANHSEHALAVLQNGIG